MAKLSLEENTSGIASKDKNGNKLENRQVIRGLTFETTASCQVEMKVLCPKTYKLISTRTAHSAVYQIHCHHLRLSVCLLCCCSCVSYN